MHFVALILASFLFADMPWNTAGPAVKDKLTNSGFKVAKKPDRAGDYEFRGELIAHPASGVAYLANGKLVRVALVITPAGDNVHDAYDAVRKALIAKYGEPEKTVERYLEPFHEGDGYEQEAIRAGKAVIASRWISGGETLVVNISNDLKVEVTYDSPEWAAEAARRNKATF